MSYVKLIFICGLLSACSVMPGSHSLSVSKVSIVNRTGAPLHDVRLQVVDNGGVVSCGYIAVSGECSAGFPSRDYRGSQVVLSWQQSGHAYRSAPMDVVRNKAVSTATEVDGVAEILPGGQVRVYFVPRP